MNVAGIAAWVSVGAIGLIGVLLGVALAAAWVGRRADAGVPQLATMQAALEHERSARVAAEAAARRADERAELAVVGSLDGTWEWRLATQRVLLSPRWKGMLGYRADDLGDTREDWLACLHHDDRAGFVAALEGAIERREPRVEQELRLRHRDGSVRHVLSRAAVIRADDGHAERVVGIDTDVTRLRRVQRVLDEVADGTAGTHGERFYAAMAEHFARALEVQCAFITECADTPATRVRTLAWWSAERGHRERFEYELAGTPCQEVIENGRTCFHPERLAQKFPGEREWESYVGMPILASDGRVLGHLALLDRAPMSDAVLVDRVYRIFLARAAAEIERAQALARLALLGA